MDKLEDYMDMLIENPYIILLGLGVFCLLLRHFYSQFYPPKSIFQKPISYVEIRAWKDWKEKK